MKRSLRGALAAGALGLALFAAPAAPERRPVLGQIDLPHNYYFREMYLPHVTSGPSAVAWMPDGRSLVYSMQGGLWQQAIGTDVAVQLTAGPGYDFQPDVSRDGRHVVFVRYRDDAMELMQLDLASGEIRPLTKNGAVNVDPRWSPDGRRIAWVSTAGTGHFHVFVAEPTADGLQGGAAWPERQSATARYYYSAFDHELSPAWSPDGKEILYVGNPEISYGTGSIFRRALDQAATPVLVRGEETTWRAHPDWAPDGKRVIYSSYAGRQWHQLWIVPAAGGDPLPLSFGDYDNTGARWSPDGKRLAFISNRAGTTEIWWQDVLGGAQHRVDVRHRTYLQPMGELLLHVVDAEGKPAAARVSVVATDGRAYAPDDAWVHADDNFDRKRASFETTYFHMRGDARVSLPAGLASVTVWHGLEHQIEKLIVAAASGATRELTVKLEPLALPANWSDRWQSGDVHVHMNYVGTYRSTPERLVGQASAEDLDLVFNLIVNKEQRIPDIAYFSSKPDAASTSAVLISHGQEFHTSYAGHLGLLGLNDHFLLPDFAAYAGTALASLVPTNAMVADLAHEQGALVGHVHPFDVVPDPAKDPVLTDSLPVEAALGKLDYYEVLGFSDPRASAAVWYRLLNCGFRPAAAGGTDAMTNYASLRGPVGLDRVYVLRPESGTTADPAARVKEWLSGLKAGRTLATNAPLLGLTLDGEAPGATIAFASARRDVRYQGFLRSAVPIDHLEIVQNGIVVRAVQLAGDRMSADFTGTVALKGTGWVLLRAWNDDANVYVLDAYPYATTNPVFYAAAGSVIHCGPDSDYFVKWIDRLEAAAQAHNGYNTAAEKDATLAEIRAARAKMLERR